MALGPSTDRHIDELCVWVHPAFSVTKDPISEPEKELLLATRLLLTITGQSKKLALAVLYSQPQNIIKSYERGDDGSHHREWTKIVHRAREEFVGRCAVVFNTSPIDDDAAHETRDQFTLQGLTLDAKTKIFGIGETPSVCVPAITRSFTNVLGSEAPGVVELNYTNARKRDDRNAWREGGWMLDRVKEIYPELTFVPILMGQP